MDNVTSSDAEEQGGGGHGEGRATTRSLGVGNFPIHPPPHLHPAAAGDTTTATTNGNGDGSGSGSGSSSSLSNGDDDEQQQQEAACGGGGALRSASMPSGMGGNNGGNNNDVGQQQQQQPSSMPSRRSLLIRMGGGAEQQGRPQAGGVRNRRASVQGESSMMMMGRRATMRNLTGESMMMMASRRGSMRSMMGESMMMMGRRASMRSLAITAETTPTTTTLSTRFQRNEDYDEESSVASSIDSDDDMDGVEKMFQILPTAIGDLRGSVLLHDPRKDAMMHARKQQGTATRNLWANIDDGGGDDGDEEEQRSSTPPPPPHHDDEDDDVDAGAVVVVDTTYVGVETTSTEQQPSLLTEELPAGTDHQSQQKRRKTRTGGGGAHSVAGSSMESLKYIVSMGLLVFSVIVVMAAIFTKQTVATSSTTTTDENGGSGGGIPPVLAFFVFWFLILWLAMMEGGQGCLVGLQPVDKELYQTSHPRTWKVASLAHHNENMEKFIVGRQFLVVLVVFVINLMASAVPDASVLSLDDGLTEVFLLSGVAVILTTIVLGQLTAQVNAASCMLDFVNNYFMLFTTYLSLGIEASGLLHSVYLIQVLFSKLTSDHTHDDNERAAAQPSLKGSKFLFWARVAFSLLVLGFSFAVTLSALFQGKTKMWNGVPEYISVILLLVLMMFVGLMEGMQIALFAVVNFSNDDEQLAHSPRARAVCQLTFAEQNLQAFLIGRQICVTICMFIVARITSIDVDTTGAGTTSGNIFGVSNGIQDFFNTGLLGAVITTIVASLIWRVVASSFPVAFLSNPLIYYILRLCLLMEYSGICSASWVLARFHRSIVHYQPDEVYLEGAERQTGEPVTRRDKDIDRVVTIFKFAYSLALLIFSLLVVMAAIFSQQTNVTSTEEGDGLHPGYAFVVFWLLILWLGMIEGGQGPLIGLLPIDPALYANSHPRTKKNTNIAHKGDNIDRFIVGRQFLVVLIVFVTNLITSTIPGASVLGLAEAINESFLATGLAVILITVMIGQLTAQVNSANCMLDFINNYLMLLTTYVSLAIEASGILHSVYLVQILFSKITSTPIETDEPPRTLAKKVLFWVRVIFSLLVLGLSFAVTLAALFSGKTTMWDGVSVWVSVVVFFGLMVVVGLLEGMQVALFSILNSQEEELTQYPMAAWFCELAFRNHNLQALLIGRQICVTVCLFVFARLTTVDVNTEDHNSENIFGVDDRLQKLFNTGFLGAIITTIAASLAWRIIASSFPIAFLSNPLVYLFMYLCLLLEQSGVCSAAWVLGRFNKLMVDYQPDEVYLVGAKRHTQAPVTPRDKDIAVMVTTIKFLYSMGLLVFSIVIVMAAIYTKQTTIAESVSPILAFFAIWGLILWLAMMEGGQGCLVGLQAVDKDLYIQSHPVSLKSTKIAHKGNNMERFIIGRQFLVVLVVFVINMCGGAVANASVLGLSDIATEIFLASGLAMILMTITLGQLTAQINSAHCMLDFINNYFMLFTTYVSLAIEQSGLLHSVYLVQIAFSKLAGETIESDEPPRDPIARTLFWARIVLSLSVLSFSFAVTLEALFAGKTTMYDGVPEAVSVILFFVLMCFVGLMEGMQIALFAVINMPAEELAKHPFAIKNCELTFTGKNLQAFLIGRQICVTICMFIVARITSVNVDIEDDDSQNIFGVSDGVQNFFNTGLLGAIITTIFASLAWRIIGSSFPVAFLSNPLIYLIIRLCLILEDSGLCSVAWSLALVQKEISGYHPDEDYIGTPAERAAAKKHKGIEQVTEEEDIENDRFSELSC